MKHRPRIILESPYASRSGAEHARNLLYLRSALRDSWRRGEFPLASHAYFPLFLRDAGDERREAIETWYSLWHPDIPIVFYIDLGMSPGMLQARDRAESLGYATIYRSIL